MLKFISSHTFIKVILWIAAVIAALFILIMIFFRAYPQFGARLSSADRKAYTARTTPDYYDGKRFFYPEEWRREGLTEDAPMSVKGREPEAFLPTVSPTLPAAPAIDEVYVTWLGHSMLLINMHGLTIITDPIYSERAGMFPFVGPIRFSKPPLSLEELPHIDVCLITHDHYDHLDLDTIKAINGKVDRFIVPLGINRDLERWGVETGKITELAWWESSEIGGLTFTLTPGLHTSFRAPTDIREKLWGSWVLEDEYHRIFASGDTGYGGHFEEIHDRFGDFDLAMLDCAQYNMQWHASHMFPEESASAAQELGAGTVFPIHWAMFSLSPHGWDDPAQRYVRAAEEKGLNLITPMIGQTFKLGDTDDLHDTWWQDIR